jgi:hypothetical protein
MSDRVLEMRREQGTHWQRERHAFHARLALRWVGLLR